MRAKYDRPSNIERLGVISARMCSNLASRKVVESL